MTFPDTEINRSVPDSVINIDLPSNVPIPSNDIVAIIKLRGDSVAGLARAWSCSTEVLSRVIHRREPFVYQEVREQLASYLGVEVWQIGREPSRAATTDGTAEAAA